MAVGTSFPRWPLASVLPIHTKYIPADSVPHFSMSYGANKKILVGVSILDKRHVVIVFLLDLFL